LSSFQEHQIPVHPNLEAQYRALLGKFSVSKFLSLIEAINSMVPQYTERFILIAVCFLDFILQLNNFKITSGDFNCRQFLKCSKTPQYFFFPPVQLL